MNFAFMGKDELAKIPFFNIFFKTIDIPVDRKSRVKSHNALQEAEEYLEKGVNLVIFPEGTSSEIAPTLLKFKNGAFRLAIEKQVPIVAVTMLDNWKLFLDDLKYLGKPGRTRVIVHQPIETKGMTMENIEELKAEVFGTIDLTLKKEYESK